MRPTSDADKTYDVIMRHMVTIGRAPHYTDIATFPPFSRLRIRADTNIVRNITVWIFYATISTVIPDLIRCPFYRSVR